MSETWYDGAYFNRYFTFRFGDCDCDKKASLYAVNKLVSEIASEDYEARGYGYDFLAGRGQAILISRMRLKVYRMPLYNERVIARTWERCVKGPYFCRDSEIIAENGELLVAVSSQWFLVDIISRAILRPELIPMAGRQQEARKSYCPECDRIRHLRELPIIGSRPVYFTDIDANGHVNNAIYSKIALDFLPDEYKRKELSEFSINFFSETMLGETLELYCAETDNGLSLQGGADDILRFGCTFIYK